MSQLREAHGLHLVSELGFVGFLEGVVLQRDNHVLLTEIDSLELQRGVTVGHLVGFLIIGSAEELERQVILRLGHLYHCRVRQGYTYVTLVCSVVIDHDSMHVAGLVIFRVDSQDISVDSVVESSGRNVDFLLCLSDVVAECVNLVV